MNGDIVKAHDFEVAKEKIKYLSEKVPNDMSLQQMPTEGSVIPWHNHSVTGEEINTNIVIPLQRKLFSMNYAVIDLFNTAKEVYNALEALDKEYIQGILAAVKSAEIASNQATASSTKASEQAKQFQDENKKIISALQNTVNILKKFKEDDFTDFTKKVNQTTEKLNNDLKSLEGRYSKFDNYKHLDNIDDIWTDVNDHNNTLSKCMKSLAEEKESYLKISKSIESLTKANEEVIMRCDKKLKIAYCISGSAFVMLIVDVILQIVGVL